jgi:hypothetical protein
MQTVATTARLEHAANCSGTFRRLYIRKVHAYGTPPKLTEVGWYCDACRIVNLA